MITVRVKKDLVDLPLFTKPRLSAILTAMESIMNALPFAQIAISILLVAAVLLQQRGSSIGGAFGSDNFSATFHKRRGSELFLFRFAIVLAVLLVASVLLTVAY
jgi:protein translocase SecG subunit